MTNNQDNRNPTWLRPDDWPFEEDFDSPAWKDRVDRMRRKSVMACSRYGFFHCPACGAGHVHKSVFCECCGYEAEITPEQHAEMDRIVGPDPA